MVTRDISRRREEQPLRPINCPHTCTYTLVVGKGCMCLIGAGKSSGMPKVHNRTFEIKSIALLFFGIASKVPFSGALTRHLTGEIKDVTVAR